MKKIMVMGAGSWGTALALTAGKASRGCEVMLYASTPQKAQKLTDEDQNSEYLPGARFERRLSVTNNLKNFEDADVIVIATPCRYMRESVKKLSGHLRDGQIIASAAKGLEENTLLRMTEVIREELSVACHVAVLSGPSHAEEVVRDIPTAVVAAAEDEAVAKTVMEAFGGSAFRVYTHMDVAGVEFGGALKNVIALAAGISDGLGYGDNTKAALMTRGILEITRLGVAYGADVNTFSGLTGIGDLIVTCTSKHSRNRQAGILIGQGKSLEESVREVRMVVEGVFTAKAAYELASRKNIEMPIVSEIYNVLFRGKNAGEAVRDLMERDTKPE